MPNTFYLGELIADLKRKTKRYHKTSMNTRSHTHERTKLGAFIYFPCHICCSLTLSLPNATVVEFTVHRQAQLQSKLIAVYFNGYKGRNSLFFFISKCSGDIMISYMEAYAIFCTRMDFQKMFVMSSDFAEIKNIENMSMVMTYRTHVALKLLYFDFFLMKQYIRINPDV